MENGQNCGTRLPQFFYCISTVNPHFKHIVEHVSFFLCRFQFYFRSAAPVRGKKASFFPQRSFAKFREGFQSDRSIEMIVECVSNEWIRISDNFRPKGQSIQFTIYLGKSFIVYDKLRERFVPSTHSPPETRTSREKKDRSTRYQRKVDTVPLSMEFSSVQFSSILLNIHKLHNINLQKLFTQIQYILVNIDLMKTE